MPLRVRESINTQELHPELWQNNIQPKLPALFRFLMKTTSVPLALFFSLFFTIILLSKSAQAAANEERSVYVVYMGAVSPNAAVSKDSLEEEHHQLLASVVKREENRKEAMVRRYKHGFSGFAAKLSEEEALAISKDPGVVSVFPDPVFQLHTTRSWDFLQLQTSVVIDSSPSSEGDSNVIIGLLDTGIWPESESFQDGGIGPIPDRWKGTCVNARDFNSTDCNRKLIGARYYDETPPLPTEAPLAGSPRDTLGHGTHTASTAAGRSVQSASYYGLAAGTAKGGSPSARIAMYKVCTLDGCRGSAILAAFDDAISDGVDILSVSLGASRLYRPDFANDPIAIGSFHAVAKGVTVVCSAGNDGPRSGTVVNAAPWILTVAATTIDRAFESDVVLGGNNKAVKGEAVNFSDLDKSAAYPLVFGVSAKSNPNASDASARNCDPDALNGDAIKGKIVLCEHSENGPSKGEKVRGMKAMGAAGLVLISDSERILTVVDFPVTIVSSEGGEEILTYIKSTKNPVATILPTVTLPNYKPAPAPDVAAPGVNILASWAPLNDSSVVPPGRKPTPFNLISGTSMACPHVSGIAALVKSANPDWSPAAIRSAIMTTATRTNNDKAPITTASGSAATPHDYGAGEISPSAALRPGLIYELATEDYLFFLCNYGYDTSKIKLIQAIPEGFQCPSNSSADLISNLNYPSIALSNLTVDGSRTVSRTLTNVGEQEETTYTAAVKTPKGLDVKVVPEKLQFTEKNQKLSFQVTFSASSPSVGLPSDDMFGSITWANGEKHVTSVFVVNAKHP